MSKLTCDALGEVVVGFDSLILVYAKKCSLKYGLSENVLEDLVSEGRLILFKAIPRFDSSQKKNLRYFCSFHLWYGLKRKAQLFEYKFTASFGECWEELRKQDRSYEHVFEDVLLEERRRLVHKRFALLKSERAKQVCGLLLRGYDMSEISKMLKISKQRVCQLKDSCRIAFQES